MEEGGRLGCRQIAYSLQPDVAIVVDVTHATDYPGLKKTEHGDVKLGAGPTLTYGGPNHRVVVDKLKNAAEAAGIPVQWEATSNSTGTDADMIFWTRGGIPTALISIPNRYMHSPVEVVHTDDLENTAKLMAEFCLALTTDATFKVAI